MHKNYQENRNAYYLITEVVLPIRNRLFFPNTFKTLYNCKNCKGYCQSNTSYTMLNKINTGRACSLLMASSATMIVNRLPYMYFNTEAKHVKKYLVYYQTKSK